jgi:hypothetical protein
MTASHLGDICNHIPREVRNEIIRFCKERTTAGKGKQYWLEGLKELSVIDDE